MTYWQLAIGAVAMFFFGAAFWRGLFRPWPCPTRWDCPGPPQAWRGRKARRSIARRVQGRMGDG